MLKEKIIKLNEVRGANTLALLDLLIHSGEISRVEMALRMNCDNTTVTHAVRDLVSRKLIESVGKREAALGRPRELLQLCSAEKLLLGVALDPCKLIGVLTDFRGRVQCREQIQFDNQLIHTRFLSMVSEIVHRLQSYAGKRLCGAGISTFGSYADDRFTITDAVRLPQLNGVSLLDFLRVRG